jgi:NAD(P)-dependent dehydrogenase (short-subunit alcohol dehydrogenase family)
VRRVSSILITGSSDGLGRLAARRLVAEGHDVVLHARSNIRGHNAVDAVEGAAEVLVADLGSIEEVWRMADQANEIGRFDVVIHNAGIGYEEPRRMETADGFCHVFAINVLAPYLLTALMTPPRRLIYVSSGMHRRGNADLGDLQWRQRAWDGEQAYADSKLFDVILAFAVARRWPDVLCNTVEPGWVPTKIGGPAAPDDLWLGADTQCWLADIDDSATEFSGRYLYHRRERGTHPAASRVQMQEELLEACHLYTSVPLPAERELAMAGAPALA